MSLLSGSSPSQSAVSKTDIRRLSRIFLVASVGLAALAGSVTVLSAGFGLRKFGGFEYVPRILALSSVREIGPGVSASAALLTLLIWTHGTDAAAVRSNLVRVFPQVVFLVIPGAALTTLSSLAAGFLVGHWVYGVPWETIVASLGIVSAGDAPAAGAALVLDGALVSAFCWLALPVMARRAWSLGQKIGATWAAMVLPRFLVAMAAYFERASF